MAKQSQYNAGDIAGTIRNAIVLKQYIETYVRNSTSMKIPPSDTVFRRIVILHKNQDHTKGKDQTTVERIIILVDVLPLFNGQL